jgi:hypothetical protein
LTTTSASLGAHAGHDAVVQDHADHAGPLEDLRPTQAGTAGERLGHVARVRGAVAGQPEGADEVVGPDQGPALLGLGGRQQLALEPVGIG